MRRGLLRWASMLAIWLGAISVRAQGVNLSAEYREAVQQAVTAYEAGAYDDALTYFERAHALAPSARTLRGIGVVELELGRHRAAAEHLERALNTRELPLEGTLREDTEHALARAWRAVARLELTLTPAHGTLRLNGWPVSTHSQHVLDPGEHVVDAEAAGYAPLSQRVRLDAGEQRALKVALEPERVADVPSRAPLFAITAASALTATGVALLIVAKLRHERVEGASGGAWRDYEDDYERAPRLWIAGGVVTGLGLAGLAAALWWQLARRDEKPSSAALLPSPHALGVRARF